LGSGLQLAGRDVTGHVIIRFPIGHFILVVLGTESLSAAVFEILMGSGVTNLTFHGHVTSSVTWALDFPYAINYWWSFV